MPSFRGWLAATLQLTVLLYLRSSELDLRSSVLGLHSSELDLRFPVPALRPAELALQLSSLALTSSLLL